MSESPQADYSLKWWVLISAAMGVFLGTIDGSIVNVALPTLQKELNTDFATVQWVVVSYLLVLTSMMLGVGRLGDMFGKKRIYMAGMAVFTLGSALCGLAPTVEFLIAFRVLQGLGGVMVQSLGMGIVTEAFPASERGRALGIMGTVVSVGISLGPALGGLLIGLVGWRAIFLVNLPVGVAGLALARRFVPDWRPPGGQRFDTAGALILLATLLMLSLGLTLGPDTGWTDTRIVTLLAGAAFGFAVFLFAEWRAKQPMVDLRMFRDPLFSVSLLTGFMMFMVIASSFLLTFYLERAQGFSTREVGMLMAVFPIMLGVVAPYSGALSDRYGSRGIAVIGLIVAGVAVLGISTLNENTSTAGYIARMLLFGLGFGIFQSPNNSAIMGAAPRERLGVVGGLLSLTRTFGQVTGLPLMGAIYASRVFALVDLPPGVDASEAPPWAIAQGMEAAYLAGAALIGVATLLAGGAYLLDRRRKRAARLQAEIAL